MTWQNEIVPDKVEICLQESPLSEITKINEVLQSVSWAQFYDKIYHVKLECGTEAVFRPDCNLGEKFFDTTVFAYSIAKFMGFNFVPPAVHRSLSIPDGDANKVCEGTLQYFVATEFWDEEKQFYDSLKKNVSEADLNDFHFFCYLLGICDLHQGNRIIDLSGKIALIDTGDLTTVKMIVANEWEFVLAGQLVSNIDFNGVPFEECTNYIFENISEEDLEKLLMPFLASHLYQKVSQEWFHKISKLKSGEVSLSFVLWNGGIWIQHKKLNYLPNQSFAISDSYKNRLADLTSETLNKLSNQKLSPNLKGAIIYRKNRILEITESYSINTKQPQTVLPKTIIEIFSNLCIQRDYFENVLVNSREINKGKINKLKFQNKDLNSIIKDRDDLLASERKKQNDDYGKLKSRNEYLTSVIKGRDDLLATERKKQNDDYGKLKYHNEYLTSVIKGRDDLLATERKKQNDDFGKLKSRNEYLTSVVHQLENKIRLSASSISLYEVLSRLNAKYKRVFIKK